MQKVKEGIMHALFLICACVSILAVVLICVYLFASGVPAIGEIGVTDFLFGTKWKPSSGYYGIFPMIIGSILVTGIAVVIGVPIGILCAVFMSHYCPKKLYRFVKPAINLLAGIPSIVYGFFGLVVIVPIMKELFGGSGKSLLTAGILLGIMILPTVIKTTESSLNAVPKSYYEGALALGATHERSVFFASLPAARQRVRYTCSDNPRRGARYRRNDGGNSRSGQPDGHSEEHHLRHTHLDLQHRNGNGLRRRTSPRSAHRHRSSAVRVHTYNQPLLLCT